MTSEAISEIMTALGPADEDVMAVLSNGDNEWLVRYPEADVEVTLVEGEGRLVFSSLCGIPPAERAAAVHATLLRFNAIWRETGSIRMALSGDDGEVLLIVDIPVGHADENHVALIARNVADRSAAWRLVVEAGAPDDAPAPAADSQTTLFRI